MAISVVRLVNVGLRFATLGVRFIFIFFLARYLDAASIGYYGLFSATVGYCLYFVGLDFHVYMTREIIRAPSDQRGRLLKGQAALSGVLYILVLPIVILFMHQTGWPGYIIWWFIPIMLLEHFNQEVSRLLIALSEQLTASMLLFVRQGSWAIAIVALMIWDKESRSLDAVMALWACAGMAAATLGIVKLKQLRMGGWRTPVDRGWIRKGVAVSAAFLVATLALRGVQTADRYWLEALGGIEIVGAYVLFLGVAGALMAFLDAAVFSYTYPTLIGLYHDTNRGMARGMVRRMLLQTLTISAAFSLVSWFLLPFLLEWIGNPIYKNAIDLYPLVLMATVINAVGMVPHYALYTRGYDKPIIYSHVAALPVFILSTWVVSRTQAVMAVPIGIGISFTLILVWKTVAYWQQSKEDNKSEPPANSI